jgi:3-oxoacyl-ACP reductase-like protein
MFARPTVINRKPACARWIAVTPAHSADSQRTCDQAEGRNLMTAGHNSHFAGKVAVVTGGSRSIGAAVAVRLATEGAAVVIGYRSNRKAAQALVSALGTAAAALSLSAPTSPTPTRPRP